VVPAACRRPPRVMRLLGWWQVLLWVLGLPVRGVEGPYGFSEPKR
ncbi:TXNDC15 isoform 5, partial [Pan troglodytes]